MEFRFFAERTMLASLAAILLSQAAGDLLQGALGLPIPGPVIGMALLLGALVVRGHLPAELERAATGILSYLPMLFVPAGVGVMAHFDLIGANLPSIAAGVVVSSILAIAVTAITMRTIERLQQVLTQKLLRRFAPRSMDAMR